MNFKTLILTAALVTVSSATPVKSATSADSIASQVSIVNAINASGHITVTGPEALTSRLEKVDDSKNSEADSQSGSKVDKKNTASSVRAGFRIQVFDDNNPRTARANANKYKTLVMQRFPEYQAYVVFNSPYWRVKVGDFRSRREAEAIMHELLRAFPSLSSNIRVIRDHINIYE